MSSAQPAAQPLSGHDLIARWSKGAFTVKNYSFYLVLGLVLFLLPLLFTTTGPLRFAILAAAVLVLVAGTVWYTRRVQDPSLFSAVLKSSTRTTPQMFLCAVAPLVISIVVNTTDRRGAWFVCSFVIAAALLGSGVWWLRTVRRRLAAQVPREYRRATSPGPRTAALLIACAASNRDNAVMLSHLARHAQLSEDELERTIGAHRFLHRRHRTEALSAARRADTLVWADLPEPRED